MILSKKHSYLIAEDMEEVCANIKARMDDYANWQHVISTGFLHEALASVKLHLPDLLFLDWELKGGNTFEILDFIKQHNSYNPYIIYFTGYTKEEKNILLEIINQYHVNKFLSKPIFEKLTQELALYLQEAIENNQAKKEILVKDIKGNLHRINPNEIACISIYQSIERTKAITMQNANSIITRQTIPEFENILQNHFIDYYMPSKRESIVAKKYIDKIIDNYIYFNIKIPKMEICESNIAGLKKWFID
jgi:two-component system, LytTR family, response regulator